MSFVKRNCVVLLILLTPVLALAQTAGPRLPQGLDGKFLSLTSAVPGFAGYFFDSNGDLNVFLTDAADEPAPRAAFADVARNRPQRPQQPWSSPAAIVIRRADFDWQQLVNWLDHARCLANSGRGIARHR